MIGLAPRSVITGVPGWESIDEQHTLFEHAVNVPDGGMIVEIGAEFGMSASIFCRAARQSVSIISIDLFPDDLLQKHQANLRESGHFGRSLQIKADSQLASTPTGAGVEAINLLFIDGDHSYAGVWRDLKVWMHLVKPDGVVIFHDAAPATNLAPHPLHYEVQQAIDGYMAVLPGDWTELPSVDSMRIFKRNA